MGPTGHPARVVNPESPNVAMSIVNVSVQGKT